MIQFHASSNSAPQSTGGSKETRSKFLAGLQALLFAKNPHMKDGRVFCGKLNEGSPANGQNHYERFLADGTMPAFWLDLIVDPNKREAFTAQYMSQEKDPEKSSDALPHASEPSANQVKIITKFCELPQEFIDPCFGKNISCARERNPVTKI
ncbi:MAG: hypothetical protein WC819_01185 [Parcubacteria group bacterium]|jgi:hypothetical protein